MPARPALSLVAAALATAIAALSAAPAHAQRPAEFYSAATLERAADSLRAAKSVAKVLGDRGAYLYVLIVRDVTGTPESHARWTDVMLVQSGTATVLLGGRYDGGSEESPGEMRGGRLVGAREQRVAPGDLVVIPAGLPHQVRVEQGAVVRYLTVKAPEPPPR
jgi:mannose-6-phosphate isomerase-like protein (cupin superfamily)